jgi:hypothetical protein
MHLLSEAQAENEEFLPLQTAIQKKDQCPAKIF